MVLSTRARTSSSLRTSALMNSASEPKERSSLTSALPASSRRPATTTFAPFLAKATAAARPMPVSPPVIKTTGLLIFYSSRYAPPLPAEHGQTELSQRFGDRKLVPCVLLLRPHVGAPGA